MCAITTDEFGFLREPVTLEFDGGRIYPLANYDEIKKRVLEEINEDGYLYPPTGVTLRKTEGDSEWREVGGSQRPLKLYVIPSTHRIEINDPIDRDVRLNDMGFIMFALAYLYGCRLQFHDWTIDGRIPIKRDTHGVGLNKTIAERFISVAHNTWKKSEKEKRNRLTNILYMHSKAPAYEWDWESFVVEYMVLDAIWKNTPTPRKTILHSQRINELCEKFGLAKDEQLAAQIVNRRNDLFHEALWDGQQPGYSEEQEGYSDLQCLRGLNQRLIPALLGWKGKYISTPWNVWRSRFVFE